MKLCTLNVFTGCSPEVRYGWFFSENSDRLQIENLDGTFSNFGKVEILDSDNLTKNPVLDGFIKYGSGILEPDKFAKKNLSKFLIAIVVEGNGIKLPEELYRSHSVKVAPDVKQDGSMTAAVVCLNKNKKLTFKISRHDKPDIEIMIYYDCIEDKIAVLNMSEENARSTVQKSSSILSTLSGRLKKLFSSQVCVNFDTKSCNNPTRG